MVGLYILNELCNSLITSCNSSLRPADLSYVEGTCREDYLHDMRLCQEWAKINRRLIVGLLMDYLKQQDCVQTPEETWQELAFESIHNYIGDDNVIRKGAIAVYSGQKCIIPLNMRDGSLICIGKGNILPLVPLR